MPFLFAFREDRLGFRFEIDERAVLGRSPECDLIIFGRAVSRFHSEIYKDDAGYFLKDLDSSNGTFHNDIQIQEPTPLKKNDEIKLGDEVFLFDPDLDVAVGKRGVVLLVGGVEDNPEGLVEEAGEPKLNSLDRVSMAALFKVATALAKTSKLFGIIRQVIYVLDKLFEAERMVVLWPEGVDWNRLNVLAMQPQDQRMVLPRPLIDRVLKEGKSVIWPTVVTELTFRDGERILEDKPQQALAVPLNTKEGSPGLIYIESRSREYTDKDLYFLTALGSLVSSAIANARMIHDLNRRAAQEEEAVKERIYLIGEHEKVKALRAMAAQVAQADNRILLEGESGTGKEILAKLIHSLSPRKKYPFVYINCASISSRNISRELFGQEGGTLDEDEAPGFLEKAEGGSVFIHNINKLPLPEQVVLLKTIEEGVVYRVGSIRPRPINCRIISSSTEDLKGMVEKNKFRADLHDRISEVTLATYPLRELGEDVILLAKYFFAEVAKIEGHLVPEMDPAVSECLRAYTWPGNAGELKNVVERVIMFHQGSHIMVEDLPLELRLAAHTFKTQPGERSSESIMEVEKDLIRKALAKTDGETKQAAEILGLKPDELEERIRRYGVSLEQTVVMQITN
ncbi:MAG: sigma 54-interacting transcriptional regulator [Deltaproteobacteria bacterium]|nr:sigma 54-interacting transcriptional regulator [Deltaproteobacteria bacterium]MBW2051346.1 sigma 54-interacting transcriptional regulator [Deltaproteobacteria bacterium]MBW2139707.1 sigma 54-interacting transcriptional regulator [Deltaproteobacteria bacterium]MBW2321954.1 sigma 54-interacting transcriptional regulator [Deltaproteobacteria bacterium]